MEHPSGECSRHMDIRFEALSRDQDGRYISGTYQYIMTVTEARGMNENAQREGIT